MPKVRWAMSYWFCNKFHTLSSNAKCENRLRFDKVTESIKVGTFLRHSVDQYCPVTVLLAIAIQCFALFACFQILHKIRKLCMKLGHLTLWKILKFVTIRCQILRLKCIKFNVGWGSTSNPTRGAYIAPQNF